MAMSCKLDRSLLNRERYGVIQGLASSGNPRSRSFRPGEPTHRLNRPNGETLAAITARYATLSVIRTPG
jgi:hypothetical protein